MSYRHKKLDYPILAGNINFNKFLQIEKKPLAGSFWKLMDARTKVATSNKVFELNTLILMNY